MKRPLDLRLIEMFTKRGKQTQKGFISDGRTDGRTNGLTDVHRPVMYQRAPETHVWNKEILFLLFHFHSKEQAWSPGDRKMLWPLISCDSEERNVGQWIKDTPLESAGSFSPGEAWQRGQMKGSCCRLSSRNSARIYGVAESQWIKFAAVVASRVGRRHQSTIGCPSVACLLLLGHKTDG